MRQSLSGTPDKRKVADVLAEGCERSGDEPVVIFRKPGDLEVVALDGRDACF
jgi:hypothetical protein